MNVLKLLRHGPKLIPLPGPQVVLINAGNVCNFGCDICPVHFDDYLDKNGGSHKLSLSDFTTIVKQIKEMGHLRSLDFEMFGEPFIYPLLLKFVKMAVDAKIADRVKVTTNGSKATPEKFEEICTSGLSYLKFSIYGVTEEGHKKVTNGNVTLAKVRDNIIGLKAWRDSHGFINPFIYVKYISETPDEDQKFHAMFDGLGDCAKVETLHNWNDPTKENLARGLTREQLLKTEYLRNDRTGSCAYPFYFMCVNSDMTLTACPADWDRQLILGDLRKQTMNEAWHGPAFKELRRKHLHGDTCGMVCHECSFKHVHPERPIANTLLAGYLWANKLIGR